MAPVTESSPAGGGGAGCLQGTVFGLTGELPRKEVQATLKAHGATVSAIIHKRVSYVLCTADAVKYNTQKVRKALKHGIPLVSQSFVAACALAKGVVDPAPFRVTTAATASTAQFSRKASQTLGSLADPGLSRPASATPAASAAASEDVREPIATGEDEADTREGLSKPKRKKCPRKSAGISPGGGATGVQGDGSNSGGGAGGAGGGDGGGVSVVPASPKDTTKKSGGKKKKRGSSGKGSGGAVVADACSDAKGVGQGGIERSNKKSKKRRKAGANAGDSDAQAVAAVAAAEDAGSKDPEGEGRGSSGAGDARSSGVGDAKKKKVKRKKGQKK